MAGLTTHILDTSKGTPAAGVSIDLFVCDDAACGQRTRLLHTVTNNDGRCDQPLIEGSDLSPGTYELHFHAGDYFRSSNPDSNILFLDVVVVRFGIAVADQHYHVPLLLAPYGYSTYRGS